MLDSLGNLMVSALRLRTDGWVDLPAALPRGWLRMASCAGPPPRPTLRNIVGGMDLGQTLTSREEINQKLRVVLEQYAPEVPGLYLYFPSRSQVSPALKAFVEVARTVAKERL